MKAIPPTTFVISAGRQGRPAETRRSFAAHEIAARLWFYVSPFPAERALAARRYRELEHVADADHVLQVIGELAIDGYHARAISERIVRDRLQHIDNEAMAAATRAKVRAVLTRISLRPHRRGGE